MRKIGQPNQKSTVTHTLFPKESLLIAPWSASCRTHRGTGLIRFTITTHYRSITTHYHPLPRITTHYHTHYPPITTHYPPITAHYRSITALTRCYPRVANPPVGFFFGGWAAAAGRRRRGSSAGCVKKRGEGRSLFQTALQFRTV